MAMTKKLGTSLQTGVDASGISGIHEQSGGRNAGGETKIYNDKDGNPIAVYLEDGHIQYSWTALMESSVADKEKGDPITVDNKQCFVTQWDVTMQNDDVKRVSIGLRSVDIPGSGTTTTTTTNP